MNITIQEIVPAPVEAVYRFFRDPTNFSLIMKDVPGFRLLHHERINRAGATIWFQQTIFRVLPVVVGFRQLSSDTDHTLQFELIHGPFDRFDHAHCFEPCEEGTRVTERMEIELPWYFGGEMFMRRFGHSVIHDIFAARCRRLRMLAEENQLTPACSLVSF